MAIVCDLSNKHCKPCEGGIPPLTRPEIEQMLQEVPGWSASEDGRSISRELRFKDYWQTMAFVNAVAWIAHQEDHHPDLEVFWGRCVVRYWTHAIDGLSENDFICAAKVDALLASDQGSR
jgi:4a-hydroxytetrahydrobiopterin dehydratase